MSLVTEHTLNKQGGENNMAQSDLDSMPTGKRQAEDPVEAGDQFATYGDSPNDVENRAAAEAAGVKDAAFINYDVALDRYASRSDVESLQRKNARDMPADFADASFMRTDDGEPGTGSSR